MTKNGLIKVNDFWVRAQLEGKNWVLYKILREKDWEKNMGAPISKIPASNCLSAASAVSIWLQSELTKK